MFSVGDIVVQRGGRSAGRVGGVIDVARNGRVIMREAATGAMFSCRRDNLSTVLAIFKSATVSLHWTARRGTQLQFSTSMAEWTRLAQLCIGLGLGRDAGRILDLCNQQKR